MQLTWRKHVQCINGLPRNCRFIERCSGVIRFQRSKADVKNLTCIKKLNCPCALVQLNFNPSRKMLTVLFVQVAGLEKELGKDELRVSIT